MHCIKFPWFRRSSTEDTKFSEIFTDRPGSNHPISPPVVYGRGLKQVLPMSEHGIQLQELRNCRSAANFVSICNNLEPDLKNNSEFMKQAARIKLDVLNYVGSYLQHDVEFWDSVCSLYPKSSQNALKIRDIQYKLLIGKNSDDSTLVSSIVSKHGRALQYASLRLKNDINIVRLAVNNDGGALQYASKECQNMFREEMNRYFIQSIDC